MESPYKKAADSPSRQLLWELGRLSVSEQQRLHERLDHDAVSRESLHKQALAAAAAEHARIRQEAEVEQEKLEARADLAREIKRQEDLREIERVRREKAEREASIRRETEEAEESARRVEDQRRREHEAKQERERQERERTEQVEAQKRADEEERQRKAAEAEAKAKEAAIAARRKQAEPQSAPQQPPPQQQQQQQKQAVSPFPSRPSAPAASSVPGGPTSVNLGKEQEQAEREHARYLEIWKQLKELRSFVKEAGKSNSDLKKAMGDGRRMIRKCVGQLVTDSANPRANAQPNMEIRNVIRDSHRFTTPTVPVSSFLVEPPGDIAQPDIPALFLYLLHIFAKCLVSQFLGEVAIAPQIATTIGITGATIFAQDDCRWQGLSLIDVFIAKCHRVCPVLFGIWGDERTKAGKQRLGWWWADESRTAFATEQRHYERMTGLGAGFAAMTLRSYKNRVSPYPAWHFWQAASRILNVPRAQVTDTHLVVLKSMIEGNEGRILDFFGRAGRVLLQLALIDFPAHVATKDGVHAQALRLIPDVLRTEKRLFL